MKYFQYGSRVVENERVLKLERNVKSLGKALKAVVNFFVAIFIFTLLNTLLHNLAQGTGLFNFSTYRLIIEGANIIVYNDALAFVSYIYDHSICIILSFAITCACSIFCKIFAMSGDFEDVKNTATYVHSDFSQSTVSANSVISYRHKVCFLA